MRSFGMNEIPYGVPSYGVCGGEELWKSEENKSKYLNFKKDTQVGLDLGSIDELEREYIEEVCDGVPWKIEES